ncbi:hypothetical protein [Bradyrhizobium sp. USDA 4508]
MATPPRVQVRRTAISNNPPPAASLLEGELAVEMGTPTRLWVGVPVGIDPTGRKLIIDVSAPGTQFVDVTGDTMTGPLVLFGAPTADLHAATKKYVDDTMTGVAGGLFVDVTGDTMTGPLILAADPSGPLGAATKQYVDALSAAVATALAAKVGKAGDTMTGPLVLSGDAAAALNPTTKQQMDAALALKVAKAGDTMTGPLVLSGAPTADLHAATKKYIDDALLTGGGGVPSGTVMVFYQAAAPTGWTKLTTQNDKALRVVSGAGGVAGGTNPFSTVMAQSVVGSFTIASTQSAYHAHNYSQPTFPGSGSPFQAGTGLSVSSAGATTDYFGGNGAHNHSITMAMQYVDVILASRN